MKITKIVILILISTLLITACGVKYENGKVAVPISLDEATVLKLIGGIQDIVNSTGQTKSAVVVNKVHFNPPDMVNAEFTYSPGNGQSVDGNADMKFSVENNQPKVEVVKISIPGVELPAEQITQLNEGLSQALKRQVEAIQSTAEFKSIAVTDKALKITVLVNLKPKENQ
ncbi:MAG TPA: hypothetical protein PKD55_21900 [Bellilinea sp.]|nr:hypothetical protein [Bellilinea sp.]